MKTDDKNHTHVGKLPTGDLAFIGDVHGELGALKQLLSHLDPSLTLVYVGDLADRGPDSPGVIGLVQRQIITDKARCILGNHELSVLRREYKKYNAWFFHDREPWTPVKGGPPVDMFPVRSTEHREQVWEFFNSLPIALERSDVRVVHAAWSDVHIEALRNTDLGAAELYDIGPHNDLPEPSRYSEQTKEAPEDSERELAWEQSELACQNDNAIRYSTSGGERQVERRSDIGWHGGKWRPLARDPWWERYQDERHVVVGHYARPFAEISGEQDHLFHRRDPLAPLGPKGEEGRVWCIDYGIGHSAVGKVGCRLAALVWRDGGASRELVFHTGERFAV